ncbi:MAG: hypothetical protein JXQ65_13615 [Candidatus Marinimicrobia bacterium]|nr:hypothetical protein [Candidatus Neomarinimicrobiota bacterium]
MVKIEKKDYGYKITFSDNVSADEMKQWVEESKKILASAVSGFCVFVDMRTLKPLGPDAQLLLESGQREYKAKGMKRSVVILNTNVIKMQFVRLARETGIDEWERYINATQDSNWEKKGVDWLTKGIDPEQ